MFVFWCSCPRERVGGHHGFAIHIQPDLLLAIGHGDVSLSPINPFIGEAHIGLWGIAADRVAKKVQRCPVMRAPIR